MTKVFCWAYKIYAGILDERVKKDIEGRLAEGQFGFREGRGAIDAIYVLNHLVDKELSKKKGKLIACFVDLKAAFDKVDGRAMMDRLKEMEVKRNLRRRITEIYRETSNMVKIEEERTEEFWTTRGVRQGCPLSPTLFNAFLSDIEEDMSKVQEGGVVIGREKVRTIVYADDIVLVATTEVGMKGMLKRFRKYAERKG